MEEPGKYFKGISVQVQNAGSPEVNGVYEMAEGDEFDGVGMYKRIAKWQGEDRLFCIFRSGDAGAKQWNISIVPSGGVPDTEECIHFYWIEGNADYPPMLGWRLYDGDDTFRVGHPPPTVESKIIFSDNVPAGFKHVLGACDKVLFSEQCSDVKIICLGGEAVPAIKSILAASSPVFEAAFGGPWNEARNGELKMNHQVRIVKAMLTFLYTGKVNVDLIRAEPIAFLSISTECNVELLKICSEYGCIQALDVLNLRAIWQAGRLYGSVAVKHACVHYALENSKTVLAKGDISLLQIEDADSWEEFSGTMEKIFKQNIPLVIAVASVLDGTDTTWFKIAFHQKLEIVFSTLSERKGVDRSLLRFSLPDGRPVNGENTSYDLQLEMHSIIQYEVLDEAAG